jgi:hypothetical protein
VVHSLDQSVSGTVVDGAGGPVRDARVTVSGPERHAEVLASTFSGNDGEFAIRGLGAGPFAVKALAPSGSEATAQPVTLPTGPLRLELPPVGSVRGTLKGFARVPSVMVWSVNGYDWDFHPAVVESDRFVVTGLSRGRYHVAASSTEASAQTTVTIDGSVIAVELAASGKRTIRGKALDFAAGGPLPGMGCQAAPYVSGARSPVVVPGTVVTGDDGSFTLVDVPAGDLYMWCMTEGQVRGGSTRLPPELRGEVTLWGLDLRGKKSLDAKALGFTTDDDQPLSRRIASVTPKGPAERVGLRPLDVVESIGGRPLGEVSNGVVRNYLLLRLSQEKSVPLTVLREGATLSLVFTLEPQGP